MNENFYKIALPLILVFEGSKFTNNPKDKGGPTKWGVTQKVYDTYRLSKKLPKRSTKEIEMKEVEDIYYNDYWLSAKCDLMSKNLSTVIFDIAVNMGVGRATKFLQKALGLEDDGIFGPGTTKALNTCDQDILIKEIFKLRKERYDAIVAKDPTQQEFHAGWMRRVKFVEAYVNGTKTLEQIKKEW